MRHKPKDTIIYCLRNPIDRNRIFYIGRTSGKLSVRLLGHIHSPSNPVMKDLISKILSAGKRPVIEQIEVCSGYLQPMLRERYWILHYNKRKYKVLNAKPGKRPAAKDRVYW